MLKNWYRDKFLPIVQSIKYVYSQDLRLSLVKDLSVILVTIMQMAAISFLGNFIDSTADLLVAGNLLSLSDYLYSKSAKWLLILLALYILISALTSVKDAIVSRLQREVAHQANLDIMKKISSENLQEVEQRDFQDLIAFVPNFSITGIFDTYNGFSEMMRFLTTLLFSIFILSQTMGWSVIFLLLISLPLAMIRYIGDQRIRNYRKDGVEGVKFLKYLTDISNNIPDFAELRVNGIFSFIIKAFRKEDRDYLDGEVKRINQYHSDSIITSIFYEVGRFGYIIYVLFVSIREKLTIGHFSALFNYTLTVTDSSYNTVRQMTIMFDRSSYSKAFFDLLNFEGFGDIQYGEAKLGKGTPRIELLKLDFMYPDEPDRKVLEDVNLVIEPGEKVAFIGADGSGKSSLVKTFCGLYEIISGDYLLDGLSVRELARSELKEKLSVILQNFVRYNLTIQSSITISGHRKNIDRKLYEEVKKITGVDQFMKKEGIDDQQVLGKFFKGGKELSPGYWQRLAIARMLYRNRDIFLMDEPFTFLDGPAREKMLNDIIRFVGYERTLIYITQNTDNLEKFDKVYYIHQGKILESGSYHQLMRKKGKFYKEAMSNR